MNEHTIITRGGIYKRDDPKWIETAGMNEEEYEHYQREYRATADRIREEKRELNQEQNGD